MSQDPGLAKSYSKERVAKWVYNNALANNSNKKKLKWKKEDNREKYNRSIEVFISVFFSKGNWTNKQRNSTNQDIVKRKLRWKEINHTDRFTSQTGCNSLERKVSYSQRDWGGAGRKWEEKKCVLYRAGKQEAEWKGQELVLCHPYCMKSAWHKGIHNQYQTTAVSRRNVQCCNLCILPSYT